MQRRVRAGHRARSHQSPTAVVIVTRAVARATSRALSGRDLSRDAWAAVLRVSVAPDDGPPPLADGRRVYASATAWSASRRCFRSTPAVRYDVTFDPVGRCQAAASRTCHEDSRVVSRCPAPPRGAAGHRRRRSIRPDRRAGQPAADVHRVLRADGHRAPAQDYIAILDAAGQGDRPARCCRSTPISGTRDHTRFTVLFDPGRVKRGILPNRAMGRPLQPGEHVHARRPARLARRAGRPLASEFRKDLPRRPADRAAARRPRHGASRRPRPDRAIRSRVTFSVGARSRPAAARAQRSCAARRRCAGEVARRRRRNAVAVRPARSVAGRRLRDRRRCRCSRIPPATASATPSKRATPETTRANRPPASRSPSGNTFPGPRCSRNQRERPRRRGAEPPVRADGAPAVPPAARATRTRRSTRARTSSSACWSAATGCDAGYPSSLLYRDRDQRVPEPDPRSRAREPDTRDEDACWPRLRGPRNRAARARRGCCSTRLFGRHPESSRTIAVLHYVDGLTLEEVARRDRDVGVGRAQAAAQRCARR